MADGDVFDLARRHVLAAADDHVVVAALDEQVAVVVDEAAVAGREPSVGIEQRPLLAVLAGHLFTSDEDLADVAGTEHGAVVVSDLDFDTRKRTPDARQALLLDRIVAVLGDTVVVGAEQGDGRRRLREPIGVDEVGDRKEFERPLDHGPGHLAATVGECSDAEHRRSAAGVERIDDAGEHGRHDHGVGHAFAFDRVDPDVGIEPGQLHDPTACVD